MSRTPRAALTAAVAVLAACGPATEESDRESAAQRPEETRSNCPDVGPEPPDGGITFVEAAHLSTEVVVQVGLTEIDPNIDQEVTVTLASQGRAWSYDVNRWVRGDGTGRLRTFFTEEETELPDGADACGLFMTTNTGLPCRGATGEVDLETAIVTARVPRACLENPASVQVGVTALFVDGHDLVMSDAWGDPSDDGDALPPLGDQLAAPADAAIGCQERVPRRRPNPDGPGELVVTGKRWCIR